jgi:hypothetical protein
LTIVCAQARTGNLEVRVRVAQENVRKIKGEMSQWAEDILYIRKDNPKV